MKNNLRFPVRIGLFLTAFLATAAAAESAGGTPAAPVISDVRPPAGHEDLPVKWVTISVPGLGVLLAAIARPAGRGPFPTIVLLHGTHGFAREYVQLADALARGGILAVAACWFSKGSGPGSRFVTPIPCPSAPSLTGAATLQARQTIDALLEAARTLPNVRLDRVALFGHSRGGGAALHYVLGGGNVQAAVVNSGGYPPELRDRAAEFNSPLLLLHGNADRPADGGSAFTDPQRARDFEAALRRAGKPVESKYYDDGGHNGIFTRPDQRADEVRRMVTFLNRHLAQ